MEDLLQIENRLLKNNFERKIIMKTVMLVLGVSPEAIKLYLLVNEFKIRKGSKAVVCVTV